MTNVKFVYVVNKHIHRFDFLVKINKLMYIYSLHGHINEFTKWQMFTHISSSPDCFVPAISINKIKWLSRHIWAIVLNHLVLIIFKFSSFRNVQACFQYKGRLLEISNIFSYVTKNSDFNFGNFYLYISYAFNDLNIWTVYVLIYFPALFN